MNNAFQKLQRKVSPEEVEKLRKLNATLRQCHTDIISRGQHFYDNAKQVPWKYRTIYTIEIGSNCRYEEYNGSFGGGMSSGYSGPGGFERKLLNGDKSCEVFNYYLFYTPFTIDDLLSVNAIYARIELIVDSVKIDLDKPLHPTKDADQFSDD